MLKATICVIIAVTAATAWDSLDPVPAPASCGNGAHITVGANSIWGVFPTSANGVTYAGHYGPLTSPSPQWVVDDGHTIDYLTNTSATFQSVENEALWVIGHAGIGDMMYYYDISNNQWHSYALPFTLDVGASIAYAPNGGYHQQLYPVPGWIYILDQGNYGRLWCYSLATSLPNVTLDGIYPAQGAIIADSTPLFQWGGVATDQYRLQVSTDSTFTSTVIDLTESEAQHQATSALANGTYFWHSAARIADAWSWSGVHHFEISAGWVSVVNVGLAGGEGAAIAYDADRFGHRSILVLTGGGTKNFTERDIDGNAWNPRGNTPKFVNAGTSLTTLDGTGQSSNFPWVAFGGSATTDRPYYYDPFHVPTWVLFPDEGEEFPENLGSTASMTCGTSIYMYLLFGNNHFWRMDPPLDDGGLGAATRTANSRAHTVAYGNAVEVEYQLPTCARVRATLHDAVGRQVGVLDAGEQQPGVHRLNWIRDGEGRRLSAGAYFVLLDMGGVQARLKAVVR